MTAISSLAELNEQNRAFWALMAPRFEKLMQDRAVRQTAFARINLQHQMRVAVYSQTTLAYELEDADRRRSEFCDEARRDFGRRGGRAKKKDALQALIDAHIAKNPNCSLRELEKYLKGEEHLDVIKSFGRSKIEYVNHDNKLKTASRSGLKCRLSRARKKLKRN